MPSKWLRDHRKQDLRDHKKRIENMKSTIDTAPPRELPMSKRNEMERERKRALVEQDNRLLLDRLAIAMSTKNIDNVLVEKPFISLMELQRKKQLKKIMIQNSRLLDRIQCTVPSYDHVQWEREAEHHVEILRNMTDFPDLFVAPGCHKKGYDMAIIDAERAQQKLIANRGVERSASASPSKQRAGQEAGVSGMKSSKKGGAGAANTKSGGNSKSNGNGAGGDVSPHSQGSRASGYVPYSYFPEEQYAQYQMQLQMQMQLQAQQQQQQQMQLQQPQYQQQQQYMYDQSQSQHTQGQMQDPNIGQFSPQYAQQTQQQSQQQSQQQTPYYNQQYQQSPSSQNGQSVPYVQSDPAFGAGVQFAPTLSPEQQYAHQQQLLLYHQQQQRLNYNNGSTNSNTANIMNANNMNANSNVYQNQPYNHASTNNTNTNYSPQLAPLNNHTINPQQQYTQYGNGSTQNVQLPNIYMLPPGHVAQPAYYNNNA